QPGVMAVTPREQVELGALANPEDAKGHEAHGVDEDIRPQSQQRVPQIAFGAPCAQRWNGQAKHQQGHADREDAIGNSSETVEVRARELVKAAPAAREPAHPVSLSASPRTVSRTMSTSRSVVRQFAIGRREANLRACTVARE